MKRLKINPTFYDILSAEQINRLPPTVRNELCDTEIGNVRYCDLRYIAAHIYGSGQFVYPSDVKKLTDLIEENL